MSNLFKDVDGKNIKEGSIFTFDWFQKEDVISEIRRLFASMKDLSDDQINQRINKLFLL